MNYKSTSIFDIDYSKITVTNTIQTKSNNSNHNYQICNIFYEGALNRVFSIPVVAFSHFVNQDKNDSQKNTGALLVRLDDESKCTEALDKLLKHIMLLYCQVNHKEKEIGSRVKGVYEGKNGKTIIMKYFEKSDKGPGVYCSIPVVNADGSLCRKASGSPVLKTIDFNLLKGKNCRGVIEFKLGRISIPNSVTVSHKLVAHRVTCLKIEEPPVNQDIADYLESEPVDNMLSQLTLGDGPCDEEKDEEKISVTLSEAELNSMNASFDIADHAFESQVNEMPRSQPQVQQPQPQFQPPRPQFPPRFPLAEGAYQ